MPAKPPPPSPPEWGLVRNIGSWLLTLATLGILVVVVVDRVAPLSADDGGRSWHLDETIDSVACTAFDTATGSRTRPRLDSAGRVPVSIGGAAVTMSLNSTNLAQAESFPAHHAVSYRLFATGVQHSNGTQSLGGGLATHGSTACMLFGGSPVYPTAVDPDARVVLTPIWSPDNTSWYTQHDLSVGHWRADSLYGNWSRMVSVLAPYFRFAVFFVGPSNQSHVEFERDVWVSCVAT